MMSFVNTANRLLEFEHREFGVGAQCSDIQDAERILGVPIRGDYRLFLLQFGWGGVEHLELFGLGADVPNYLNLVTVTLSERFEVEPRLRHDLIPVMNDGGGNLYCLDTSELDDPPVVFWDHEAGPEQIPEVVATNFNSWINDELNSLNCDDD